MDCKQFEACVDDLTESRLSKTETQQAREHLASCNSCQNLLETTSKIKQVMQDLSIPKLSKEFDSNLSATLSSLRKKNSAHQTSSITQLYSSNMEAEAANASHFNFSFSKLVAGLAIFFVSLSGINYLYKAPPELVAIEVPNQEISQEIMNKIVMQTTVENNQSGFSDLDIHELLDSTYLATNSSEGCLTKLIEGKCEMLLYTTGG
jgi:hypothetical protein